MTIDREVFALGPTPPTLEADAVDTTAPSAREDHMQLPFLSAVPDHDVVDAAPEPGIASDGDGLTPDAFRILADFQDVIDAAADAGLIDDEAAVVFHRQLIAWSRADQPAAPADVDQATDEAAAIIDRAQREVAQIRALTLTECDNILDAARVAAEHIRSAALADAI